MKNRKFIINKIVSVFILAVFFSTICTDTVKAIQNENLKEIKILLKNENITIGMEGELGLSAILQDNSRIEINNEVVFKSTNEDVIKISSNKDFKAVGQGFVLIKAYYKDKETSMCISVLQPPEDKVDLNKQDKKILIRHSRDIDNVNLE